ncbi:hypothetical protein HY732_01425 [Candidatus Uhrbacteria bacterium]|nr:hypothetical protein [Candidatus Uhrbacteria bacterium]
MYSGKLSIPGKLSDELSYVFIDDEIEQQNDSIILFGMFDIKSGNELYHIIIKESVKHFLDFYHRARMLDGEGFDNLSDSGEFIFESSMHYTYEKVSDALRDAQEQAARGQHIDMRRVNCVLGAFIHDTLFLSVTGTTLVPFLMYPLPGPVGASRYSMIDIIKQSGDAPADLQTRLFSNIISGKISIPSSMVILCNQTLLDYIDPPHIKQIISNTPVSSVVKNFHSILSKVNSRADFSALFFSNSSADNQYSLRSRSTLSSTSMQGLNSTETRTHSILTPTVRPYLKKYSRELLRTVWIFIRRAAAYMRGRIAMTFSRERRAAASSLLRASGTRIRSAARHSPAYGAACVRALGAAARSVRTMNIREHAGQTNAWLQARHRALACFIERCARRFAALSPQSRLLFLLSVLFIFLFIVSLISIQLRRGAEQAGTRTREIIAGIEQKNDLIDASMIYDDRQRARVLLGESYALLDLVPKKFHARGDFKAAEEKLKSIDLRLNNIMRLDSLDVAAALAPDASGAVPNVQLVANKAAILAYSADTLYLFDKENNVLNPLENLRGKIPSISCAVASSDTVFYFCSGNGERLYSLTFPDQTVKNISLPRHESETSLDTVRMYNNRLYVLTRERGIIYRHLAVATGFSRGAAWTQTPQEAVKNASSFAIDGNVYVLGTDGNIRLFSSGVAVERTTSDTTKKALIGATMLWTNSDEPFLYALNPDQKKLIALHKKTFEIAAQIVSDHFTGLQGFTVNRKSKEIFILDAGRMIHVPFDVK